MSKGKKRKLKNSVRVLIIQNLDYVEALARKTKRNNSGIELDDLIQAGRVGLIEAAIRYDCKKVQDTGASFKTYAYSWINKYMIEEIKKLNYLIHIPDKKLREVSKINTINNDLFQILERVPTYEEISIEYEKRYGEKIDRKKLLNDIALSRETIYSLDATINSETGLTFADILEDPDSIEDTLEDLLPNEVQEVLRALTPREVKILEVRFGIGAARAHTIDEIASELQLSRQRIVQIEAKALRKLRHPSRSRRLKDFLK